jgi:hypothetical protein
VRPSQETYSTKFRGHCVAVPVEKIKMEASTKERQPKYRHRARTNFETNIFLIPISQHTSQPETKPTQTSSYFHLNWRSEITQKYENVPMILRILSLLKLSTRLLSGIKSSLESQHTLPVPIPVRSVLPDFIKEPKLESREKF